MASSSVKQSSPFTNFAVEERATLTWTIDGFDRNDFEEAFSPDFSPKDSDHEFKLRLNASNHLFDANRVFLELYYNTHKEDVLFCYRVSIIDPDGEKHFTKEYIWKYREPSEDDGLCEYNVTSYIARESCDNFLKLNGGLKIYCEVDILTETPGQLLESFGRLSQNLQTFFENGKWTDFVVTIGDKHFKVHKNILAANSAVFSAMFEHDQTSEVKEGRVVIEDVEVEVFELLLRYIYSGKMEQPLSELAAELFVAADKYQLDHLKSICEQSLISELATESVCSVLLLSDMHNAEQLKSHCIEYIIDNWNEVKETKCWKEDIKGKRADLIEQILDSSANSRNSKSD